MLHVTLRNMLDTFNVCCTHTLCLCKQVPYRVLNFLTSYINYGGRVTDYIDLRTIDVLMRTFYTPRVCK